MKLVTAPPKSQQIADYIREQIQRGTIGAGERLESVRKLADRFEVGRQVVLSAFDILSEENLIYSQVGRGTFVKGKAAGVISQKNYRIGFMINKSRVETFFNRNLFLGAAEKAGEAGVTMLLAPFSDEFDIQAWIKAQRIDALVLSGRVDDDFVKYLNGLKIPFLIIGNYYLPAGINVIESNEDCIIEVIQLAKQKFDFKSIGAVLGPADIRSTKDIIKVLRSAAAKYSLLCSDSDIVCSDSEDGYKEMRELAMTANMPDLLFITGQAFPGVARYIFERSAEKSFKRPLIITAAADECNIIYPELIDAVIYGSARVMGNTGIEQIIKLLNGEIESIKYQVERPEYEFLSN